MNKLILTAVLLCATPAFAEDAWQQYSREQHGEVAYQMQFCRPDCADLERQWDQLDQLDQYHALTHKSDR